jgi:hypothetical protein
MVLDPKGLVSATGVTLGVLWSTCDEKLREQLTQRARSTGVSSPGGRPRHVPATIREIEVFGPGTPGAPGAARTSGGNGAPGSLFLVARHSGRAACLDAFSSQEKVRKRSERTRPLCMVEH